MASFILTAAFVIFYRDQLFALPLPMSQAESASQFFSKVPSSDELIHSRIGTQYDVFSSTVINISASTDDKACKPPVLSNVFIDMGCRSKVMYDDFQENRIPQLLPQIKCVTSLPTFRYRTKRTRAVCEEVRYSLPVMYVNTSTDDANVFQYISTYDSISVSCIRSRRPSLVVEKISPDIGIGNLE